VLELTVADARRLVEAAPSLHQHLADPLVLEEYPALQYVHELGVTGMLVPLAVRCLARARAYNVRDHLAARGAPDPQVAVFEVAAQAAFLEFRLREMAYREPPRAHPARRA